MAEGKIIGWRPDRGFGFIQPDDGGGEDVFFHIRDLQGVRPDQITLGQRVTYRVEKGQRGLQAKTVRFLTKTAGGEASPSSYRFLNPYNFVRYLAVVPGF